ncbi:MAG: sugar ABC transporter permease [Chloroflexota bacterium]|jgi:raffinose/stachyose/melibiose transport system permease protein|uniref:Sugar ABC transporter permease n=1 Tax=Candidatus Thermofonsia Clade 1 bacterium TaxID=2364210 RepID=A0A2M8PXI4_9CHLR|nr:MAG: sugar ABC transporter permease [Candidatus Thermofonsia Clade 1 bacterium]RMF51464.1 MAG: sugar ABC transporter permease [Chloroflexota bacterium]
MSTVRFRVLPQKAASFSAQPLNRTLSKWLTIGLLVAPGMIVFLTFLLIPIAQSSYYSLFKWNGFGPPTNFRGLDNYVDLLSDGVFLRSIGNSLILMTSSLLLQLPLALGLALLVGRGQLVGRHIFRAILFIPYVFSEVITALIWLYVLHPNMGLMNRVFEAIIPNFKYIPWLADRNIALYAIFLVLTWKYFGFYMILYMAGLQAVPKELEEAGRIDGCNEFQVLRFVTIPLLGRTIRLTIFLSVLGSFQQFVIIWILTQGGPVNATSTIATYLYKYGIQRFALGYGSAVAVVLFCITLFFSLGYQRLVMRQDYVLRE